MKKLNFVLVMLIVVLAVAACAPQAAPEPTAVPAVEEAPVEEAPAEEAPAAEAPAAEEAPAEEAPAAEPATGTITLYTSEPEDKVNEMVADFNTLYPDVTVNVFRSGSGEVIAKLQAEKEAGEIQADIIWFADIDFFANLAEEGLMMEYRPVGSDKVDEMYHYNGDRYQEVRVIFNVVAYNTALVTTPPTSWNDLLNPEYAGKVGMPSALYSGAAFNQVGTLMNMPEFGIKYFEDLNANKVVVERGNGAVQTKLASGEFVIGQLVDFMARDVKNAGSPVDHIWPAEGALLVPTPIGIISSTKNAGGAKAFMDYMYTENAQNLFAKQGYLSVMEGIEAPAGTPDMANFKVLMPDLTYISANRDKIRSEFERIYGVAEESK